MLNTKFTLSIPNKFVTLPKPCVMGIVNCSALSFFNGNSSTADALKQVDLMVKAGAAIIDIGAVATNPAIDMQNDILDAEAECEIVLPIVVDIAKNFDVLISVDTSQPLVMREAIKAGAHIINDQKALSVPGALEVIAEFGVAVCLMHNFNPPRIPDNADFLSLLQVIKSDLNKMVASCLDAGISKDQIIIDPGFGGGNFGKSMEENFYLLSKLEEFLDINLPILVGLSRKSMFGDLLSIPVSKRLNASVVAATVAAMKGASIIRAHDVFETVEAMRIINFMNEIIG